MKMNDKLDKILEKLNLLVGKLDLLGGKLELLDEKLDLNKIKLPPGPRASYTQPEFLSQVAELYDEGWTQQQIADEMECSQSLVSRSLRYGKMSEIIKKRNKLE